MAWVTAAVVAASALMSARRADQQAEATKQNNLAQAEMTRYSPWTGMKGEVHPYAGPGALEAGIGGAIQGAGAAQGLGLLKNSTTPTGVDGAEAVASQKATFSDNASNATGMKFDGNKSYIGGWSDYNGQQGGNPWTNRSFYRS